MRLLPGLDGFVSSPEDVIIGKMLYYREGGSEKHLRDITGIIKTSSSEVDLEYISRWAEDLRLSDIWQAIKAIGQAKRS